MSISAEYLLRFDDICPTMNWEIWEQIETLLREKDTKPILAVVPDNQDTKLMVDFPCNVFWERVRKWQAWGWTIGLHGYQHRYVTKDAGIIGFNSYSEFAGLTEAEQEAKLRRGIEIFQRENVKPDIWVAPAHSFDRVTVSLLPRFGIKFISDGFAFLPYTEDGMMWMPQQLWQFSPKRSGVWTVCYHHNSWKHDDINTFSRDLEAYRSSLVSLAEVLSKYTPRSRNFKDISLEKLILSRRAYGRLKKQIQILSFPFDLINK